ncbi:MAG: tRNA (adenosine(37)-N6)-dimethylallyltransferase MiaA [Desulfobacterales bacterium]
MVNPSYEIKPKIVVIGGPTGIGKTELSLKLAETFHGGIVSADSMQIYRFMDIGTAKPGPVERKRALHFMIDVADPDEPYDAARFAGEARDCIAELTGRGMLPFVIGGTGFYINALLYGLCEARPASAEIRKQLRRELEISGSCVLYERLADCDPEAAGRIHPNDSYRVIRALEVYQLTGQPMSAYQQAHGFQELPFDALKICLTIDREILYARINQRVDEMLSQGLLAEVRELLEKGYSAELNSMKSIGYRHMADYIQGRLDWEEAVSLMKRDTRRYAKRQLVWFRKDPGFKWMAPGDTAAIEAEIREFLARDTHEVKV